MAAHPIGAISLAHFPDGKLASARSPFQSRIRERATLSQSQNSARQTGVAHRHGHHIAPSPSGTEYAHAVAQRAALCCNFDRVPATSLQPPNRFLQIARRPAEIVKRDQHVRARAMQLADTLRPQALHRLNLKIAPRAPGLSRRRECGHLGSYTAPKSAPLPRVAVVWQSRTDASAAAFPLVPGHSVHGASASASALTRDRSKASPA